MGYSTYKNKCKKTLYTIITIYDTVIIVVNNYIYKGNKMEKLNIKLTYGNKAKTSIARKNSYGEASQVVWRGDRELAKKIYAAAKGGVEIEKSTNAENTRQVKNWCEMVANN